MKTSELLRILKDNGIVFFDHKKSHDQYYSPITQKKIMVPRHKKEVPVGTANAILKLAGIKRVSKESKKDTEEKE